MPQTYEPIATTTITTSTSSFNFNSISGSYTDLVLVASNVTSTSAGGWLSIRFNSDSGTNYSFAEMYGNGTSASSFKATNASSIPIDYNVTAGVNHTGFISVLNIMNYANTNSYTTVLVRENNASDPSFPGSGAIVGLWRNTTAITSITVVANIANFNAGTFTLYGIKAA